MANKIISGYIFPNIPKSWSQEEKSFALALRQLFDRLFSATSGIGEIKKYNSGIDYISMMAEIEIPVDTSDKVKKIGSYYANELWNKQMVWDAVSMQWITSQDYEDITGETFPVSRP